MHISVLDKNGRQKHWIETENEGKTLLSILQEHQVYLDAPCGGRGVCKKCKIKIVAGNGQEEKVLLACQVIPKGDCVVEAVCSNAGQMQAVGSDTKQKTAVKEIRKKADMVIGADGYGIAIDIGTTTLAAALVCLSTGERVGTVTGINHQRMYGADVIARIQAANQGRLNLLQKTILSDLGQMMTSLLAKTRVAANLVKKIVIAGNTVMCHLLMGYSCLTLGVSPFEPVDISLIKKPYPEIFHAANLSAETVILPGISAFIGADIVSGIYAGGLWESTEDAFFLDIGTNGEMAVGNSAGFLAAGTAAGPVFEGGGISCGVPGVVGAVSHISLNPDATIKTMERIGDQGEVWTVGKKDAVGLCGSGIIDMVGELVSNRLIDEEGLLKEPWFTKGVSVCSENVRFMQSDIRQFQMGKAAIRTGIETLLTHYYGSHKTPSRIFLAGGFGYHMDIQNAVKTGLLPPDFTGRVKILGNSALEGAIRYLTEEAQELVTGIVNKTRVINLAKDETFLDSYVENMRF